MKIKGLFRLLLVGMSAITFMSLSASAQDAASLYKTKCAACHGTDGKGDTPMAKKLGARDFGAPAVQKQSDDQLTAIINDGKNKMPGYSKSLKPDQVKQLVAHIRTFKS